MPLDPALSREVIRHELLEGARSCPHDGAALVEIGVETSEQLDIIPQLVRVLQHKGSSTPARAAIRASRSPRRRRASSPRDF
jgi:hypothetical protein